MKSLKRSAIKSVALASALVGGLCMVPTPASAQSFGPTDDGTHGYVIIGYDDGNDEFCVEGTESDGMKYSLAPKGDRPGPRFTDEVLPGMKNCYRLERAYEDAKYYFNDFEPEYPPIYFYS